MAAADSSSEPPAADEAVPGDLAEAGFYRTAQEGFEHGLVILALGLPYWLLPTEDGYQLWVPAEAASRVRTELACFDRESVGWPPRLPPPPAVARFELMSPLLWALAVLAVFRGQAAHPEWVDKGALDTVGLFRHGEFWRPLTALFLHADQTHLVSNLLGGVFASAAVLSTFGRIRGWMLLGLSAVAGNVAAAAVHYPGPYRSLGASTAIFAALGLLTGRAVRIAMRAEIPHRWRSFFMPLATGVTVLALFGAGAQPVDVLAHVTGFVAGGLAGVLGERPPARGRN